jgi:hypothetical protein
MYEISDYTKNKAKQLGLIVYPSDNPKYKLEVYDEKTGLFKCYLGASGYKDFEIYLKENGIDFAENRRRLYFARHQKDISKIGSRGWLSWCLLWRG